MRKTNKKTNITPTHKRNFHALRNSEYDNFALFSCFIGGEPTSAIVAITKGDDDNYLVAPLFVAVTPGLLDQLTDHDGIRPIELPEKTPKGYETPKGCAVVHSKATPRVVIEVRGGAANVIHKDKGVILKVIDFDNESKGITETWLKNDEEKE